MHASEPDRDHLLSTYLNDHLMGAAAGVDLFRRVAAGYSQNDDRVVLYRLAEDVAEDRDSLLVVMKELGVRPRAHRMIVGRLGEKVGRLKTNGTLWKRSPLTDLVELEALRLGVQGKLAMWQALQEVEGTSRPFHIDLETLVQRARSQIAQLETMRPGAAQRAWAS